MIDYKKIAEIMCWKLNNGQTHEELFISKDIPTLRVPDSKIVDVVHAGSVDSWAKKNKFNSEEELKKAIMEVFRLTITDETLNDAKTNKTFKPIYNFHTYCNRLDTNGKLEIEATKLADVAWNGELAKKRLEERTNKMFDVEPSKEKYDKVAEQIKEIWGFSNIDVDALRYFVCQTRHKNHNPSMNKAIYLWAEAKQTGKTTIARTIVSILNGEKDIDNAGEYESTLSKEMQYNTHEVPKSSYCNAVILDEAMPKDSRKSYGQVKQMLTSNSCSYNPKFMSIINIPCKRYYFCTSNDDIAEFIQDESERRFFSIKLDKTPKQISFEKIYNIWKEFCTNAQPEPNWQDWYDSFEHVDGLLSNEIQYFTSKLLTTLSIHEELLNMNGTYVSTGFFHDSLAVGKATRDEKKAINEACEKLFGKQPFPSKWRISEVNEALRDKTNFIGMDSDDEVMSELNDRKEAVDALPF